MDPITFGPLQAGHYVQISLGLGFYVPESDYKDLQREANRTNRTQYLGVTKSGQALRGASLAEVISHPDSAGVVACLVPSPSSNILIMQ
jgi:hypothetical protein